MISIYVVHNEKRNMKICFFASSNIFSEHLFITLGIKIRGGDMNIIKIKFMKFFKSFDNNESWEENVQKPYFHYKLIVHL